MTTSSSIHVLLVEDDPEIRVLMSRFLNQKGYSVSLAIDRTELQHQIDTQQIDLVLLDVMLPAESGYELCTHIRQNTAIPVIMVTALADVRDRVIGLDLGADDYISKPFDLVELEARIRAVLRRSQEPDARSSGLQEHVFGPWKFVPSRRALYGPGDLRITLSGSETDLMLVFWQHAGELLSRSQIIELVYGAPLAVEERAIDLLVSRLRRKLAEGGRDLARIKTIRGDGYVFDAGAERS